MGDNEEDERARAESLVAQLSVLPVATRPFNPQMASWGAGVGLRDSS